MNNNALEKLIHQGEKRVEKKPVVLITGGVGGIGRATADWLESKGWLVIVADIDQKGLNSLPETIHSVYLDVIDGNSLCACANEIEKFTDGLDAIIHCAGILVVGSVIEVPVDEIMRILNVNLLGIYRINQMFVPRLLKRGGRIIIISSEIGVQTPIPLNGPYAISKYALEAYSETLRRELDFLGIKVIKIRPGAVESKMTRKVADSFQKAATESKLFTDLIQRNIALLNNETSKATNPITVAKVIHRALISKHPKPVYNVNQDIRRSVISKFPLIISDRLINWFLRR